MKNKDKSNSANLRRSLELFIEHANELEQRRLIKQGGLKHIKFTTYWEAKETPSEVSYKLTAVDEEDFRSLLLILRHFISPDEPVFVNYIFNECERHLKASSRKEDLRSVRRIWSETLKTSAVSIVDEAGTLLTPQKILGVWINGYYFHSDSEASAILKRWDEFLPILKSELLFAVQQLVRIIQWLGSFLNEGLQENWFDFPSSTA